MSKFKKLQSMLEKQGHSAESAGAIAASAGRKKFGKKVMAKSAAEHKPAASVQKAMKK